MLSPDARRRPTGKGYRFGLSSGEGWGEGLWSNSGKGGSAGTGNLTGDGRQGDTYGNGGSRALS